MKIFVVFWYLASLLPGLLAIPLKTTPLHPKSQPYVSGLSKTAQIIRFVNSVYTDGGRSFNRKGGHNDFFPNDSHNQPLVTTIGLSLGKMLNLFHSNGNASNEIQNVDNNIRYYIIDNPEVLERYRQKRMNDKRRQSQESFVSFGDYASSSSLERQRKHAIRRYVANFGLREPDIAVESNGDINTDDILKDMMPKAMNDNTEVPFQPSFPDEDLTLSEDPDLEAKEPENIEQKPELTADEALKLNAESGNIPFKAKEGHRNLKANNHHKDLRSGVFKQVRLGRLHSDNHEFLKNLRYNNFNGLEGKTTQRDKNEHRWSKKEHWVDKKQYRPKLSEAKIAERFTLSVEWKKGADWKREEEYLTNKEKEVRSKKKKNGNGEKAVKKDYVKKHDTNPNKNSRKDKDSAAKDWQKNPSPKKDKRIEVEHKKLDIERENEWYLRDKKRNRYHNRNPHKNKDEKREDYHKKSEEYDKHRPDWDKKIDNDDYDKKDDRDRNDGRNKKDNERYQRNDKKEESERSHDWNKKENPQDRKDDEWNKKYNDWNNNNDNIEKSVDNRKTENQDKNNDDFNKNDNQWDKKDTDTQWKKKDTLRNKKDEWISQEVDWGKKENSWNKKNKKSTADGSNWGKVENKPKIEDWGKYDEKNTYNSGENKKKKKKYDDYNSYEKKPKKNNEWDNYDPKIPDYYKPKKIKRQDSDERPRSGHNPPPAFAAFGRTPIPFAGQKRIYSDK